MIVARGKCIGELGEMDEGIQEVQNSSYFLKSHGDVIYSIVTAVCE